MKLRTVATMVGFAAALMVVSVSARAEETGGAVGSGIHSTTVGGSVDSSVDGAFHAGSQHESVPWWYRFFHRLGFHSRH